MNSKTWIQRILGSFLYRFAPLQHYKILRAASQASSKTVSSAHSNLSSVISVDAGPLLTPKVGFENASEMINSLELASRLDELLHLANPGLHLELKPSSMGLDAGIGVFITKDANVTKGSILCMYPGVVYDDPHSSSVFLQSIRNNYVFKSFDGIIVDGKAGGLSGILFRSHQRRHKWKSLDFTKRNVNPFFLAQLINNGGDKSKGLANCRYQELDIHPSFRFRNHGKIPNVHARMDWEPEFDSRRVVLILATRDIPQGQELLSSYNEVVL